MKFIWISYQKVLQAILCVLLALILDINQIDQQKAAEICNNMSLAIVIVVVALNVVISSFDIKNGDTIKKLKNK